jgi:metallo-beta-lactamase family protein
MDIKFCGAAREVTGSCHLITLDNNFRILLDCGLYQGGEQDNEDTKGADAKPLPMAHFNDKWLFNPKDIDCLIVSHAHIDHTGRIPKLVADGFRGKIYSTHATRDLCALMLMDSAKIQESDARYRNKKRENVDQSEETPLYTTDDVYSTLHLIRSVDYEEWFYVCPDVQVMFRDAGHILGSASVSLEIKEGDRTVRIGFTGDIGRPARPILKDPKPMPEADVIICESTYGDRLHESAPNEMEHLAEIVRHTCVEKKGKLIIPAFSVGRTQEVVYALDQLQHAGKLPRIPVFVDSPLAVKATDVFISHPECFDKELHTYMIENDNPFGFNGLNYVRTTEGSKSLNTMDEPAIIIAASGMMTAGRIIHHLFNNIEDERCTFLIIGYCPPNSYGGLLRNGAKHLHVFGQHRQVLAEVAVMDSFSAHGDQEEMFDFIQNQRNSAQKVFLVHGTIDRQEVWRNFLLEKGFKSVEIPELGQTFDL